MIQRDNGDTNNIIGGFGEIEKQKQIAEQKRQMAMPIPQAAADYIQHLLNNPHVDAGQLGREAAAHPEVADWLKGGTGGGIGQPSVSNVGPGEGPGSPALYNPTGQGPAAGPGGGEQSYGGRQYTPGESVGSQGRTFEAPMAGPPAQPTLQGMGLGPQLPAQHQQSLGMLGYSQQGSMMQGAGDGGASFLHTARTQIGQPTQGAPQLSPQQAQQAGGPAMQPGGGPQVPRQNFPAPQFRGGDTLSYRELGALQPTINGAQASQRSTDVARINSSGKQDAGVLKSQTDAFTAKLRAAGVSEQALVKLGLGQVQEEGKQQRFAEHEKGLNYRSETAADAQKSSAGIKAKSGDNKALLADFNQTMNQIRAWKARTDWETQPDIKEKVDMAERHANTLRNLMDLPQSEAGPVPGNKPPAAKPGKAPAPGKAPPAAGKIHFQAPNGRTGWVDPAGFDEKTMKRIP
jgi:hypothetical protein